MVVRLVGMKSTTDSDSAADVARNPKKGPSRGPHFPVELTDPNPYPVRECILGGEARSSPRCSHSIRRIALEYAQQVRQMKRLGKRKSLLTPRL